MKLKDEAGWKEGLEKNKDPYGAATYRYTEKWANLMEERMAKGESIEQCADKASHDADTEGITGFMYGCAVRVLAEVWKHGEELRKWHNLKTQVGSEGEKANKSGSVLNPALLTVGKETKVRTVNRPTKTIDDSMRAEIGGKEEK